MKRLFISAILVSLCLACSSCNTIVFGTTESLNIEKLPEKSFDSEQNFMRTEENADFYNQYAVNSVSFPQFFFNYSKTTQQEVYSISGEAFILNDVVILYPVIDIPGNTTLADALNQEIFNLMFLGLSKQEIADYPGVMMARNTYAITYTGENCFSLCFYIDATVGLTAQSFWSGMTVDINLDEKLKLQDLQITKEMIEQTIENREFLFSRDLIAIRQIEDITALIKNIDPMKYFSFFLTETGMGLIVENQALSTAESGIVYVIIK